MKKPEKKEHSKKKIGRKILNILLSLALVLVVALFVFREYKNKKLIVPQSIAKIADEREPWMTIFVHGSFGSVYGFLDFFHVINDDVEGTKYKEMVGRLRYDPFFYQEQPLRERGLLPITPSYNLADAEGKKYGAFPLIKAYDDINELIKPNKEKNFYYTFGWSGLVSQRRRRMEAVRFYNALNEELEKFAARGIKPKIRVLTHSHGGNTVAYISIIDRILEAEEKNKPLDFSSSEKDERGVILRETKEYLDSLPDKKTAANQPRQKRWDYKPTKRFGEFEELILWGMPVQMETDFAFVTPVFKNVFHCYSDEDLVQRIDWVSTKKHYSDRRFKYERMYGGGGDSVPYAVKNRIVQTRIMIGHDLANAQAYAMSEANSVNGNKKTTTEEKSIWKDLFFGGTLMRPKSNDPSHRELWFFTWHQKPDEREYLLAPFPVMVFAPLCVKLINSKPRLTDVDLNIIVNDKAIGFQLAKHNDMVIQGEQEIPRTFIDSLKNKVEPWRAQEATQEDIFKLIRKYGEGL